jgi:hypothetical protein
MQIYFDFFGEKNVKRPLLRFNVVIVTKKLRLYIIFTYLIVGTLKGIP